MSIELNPLQFIKTANSNQILTGAPSGSISFFAEFDHESDLSDLTLGFLVSKESYSTFSISLIAGATNSGTVRVRSATTNQNGTASTPYTLDVFVGTVNHFALVYANGSQKLYHNGVDYQIGSLTGTLNNGTQRFQIGNYDFTPSSGFRWKIDKLAVWNGYSLSRSDVLSLRGGAAASSIQGGYTARYEWSLSGPSGSTVQVGDSGLADKYGVYNFNLIGGEPGAGTPVYKEDLQWFPSAFIKDAYVGTCGKVFFVSFQSSQGAETTAIKSYEFPTIYKNGIELGRAKDIWLTGMHSYIMYTFPSGTSATSSDEISISTSGWITTQAGDVADLTNYVIANKTNRSCFDTENLVKTLPMGFNVGSPVSNNNPDIVFKNLKFKCPPFTNTTVDASGYPISTSAVNCAAGIFFTNMSNGIDNLLIPGITGFVAVSWDRTNNSIPTSFFLHAAGFSTDRIRCIERLDLYNPGDSGTFPGKTIGITRVYEVIQVDPSVTLECPLTLYMTATNNTPYFDNVWVQSQEDFTFTSGVPVVLDKSDKYAISNIFRRRVENAGSLRWMDQCVGNPIQGNIVEWEDCVGMDDFSYSATSKRRSTIYYDHIRPFTTGNAPYFYSASVGVPFDAILKENITSNQTVINIQDAKNVPIIFGQKLMVDEEVMNVIDVSGDYVTIQRGHESTTPTSHNSGVIQVGYRVPTYGTFNTSHAVIEFVSVSSHYLRTGYTLPYNGGTLPYLKYTNGNSGQIWTSAFHIYSPVFVTSPSSYLVSYGISNPPASLSGIYDIREHYSTFNIPYNFYLSADPCFPPGAAAAATARVPGNVDFHWNIPPVASNDFIIKAARDVRDNFPPGRTIWVELSNEPWNYIGPNTWFRTISQYMGYSYFLGYYVTRTMEAIDLIKRVFDEDGRNRSGEIKGTFNIQPVNGTVAPLLNFAASRGIRIDSIANAPYISSNRTDPATNSGYGFCDPDQLPDLYIHNLYYNNSDTYSFVKLMQNHTDAINDYNVATTGNCIMIAYEGDMERPITTNIQYNREKSRDLAYSDRMVTINQDWFALLQKVGYKRFNIFTLCYFYYQGVYMWPYYLGALQRPGMGDGSDGLADNRLCLATPGYEHSKDSGTSIDNSNVSTRGMAFVLWNQAFADTSEQHINNAIIQYSPNRVLRNIFFRN